MNCNDTVAQYDSFYKTARKYQEDFKSQITLLVGVETEWIHSNAGSELEEFLKLYPVDYIVGSVHHLYEIPIDFSRELFEKVVDKASSALNYEAMKCETISRDNLALDVVLQDYFDAQYDMLVAVRFNYRWECIINYYNRLNLLLLAILI